MNRMCLVVVFLMAVGNVLGTTYYVSPTGNDAHDGLGHSTAFATCAKAVSTVNPGDTVLFGDGTYDARNFTITRSGTAKSWITFKSITKWGARITAKKVGQAIVIGTAAAQNVGYIVIDGFDLSADHRYGCGVHSGFGTHHLTVKNCWAHDCGQSGIQLNDGDYRVIEDNVCNHNSYVSPPEGSGISLWGRKPFDSNPGWHNFIRGNICFDNENSPKGPNSDGNGVIIDDFRNTQGGHTAGAKDVNYAGGETLI